MKLYNTQLGCCLFGVINIYPCFMSFQCTRFLKHSPTLYARHTKTWKLNPLSLEDVLILYKSKFTISALYSLLVLSWYNFGTSSTGIDLVYQYSLCLEYHILVWYRYGMLDMHQYKPIWRTMLKMQSYQNIINVIRLVPDVFKNLLL